MKKNNRIDLHIHTNISDGMMSPKEIIDEASKNEVTTIAIADHDTIDAYTEELYNYAKSKNIKLINAVEISTKIEKCGIHVLGYNFDIKNQELKNKLYMLRNARHKYLRDVAVKLEELGYVINVEELDKIDAVTKAHISLDIVNNEKNNKLLMKTFNHIPTKGEFIETIMNEGCPAYTKKESITPKQAVELIKKAGGKAVLAHPIAYQYEDNLTDEEIANIVKEMKPDGIEANYVYVKRNGQKVNDAKKWNEFARQNNLIVTIGSDFHKKDNIHPKIGLIDEDIELTSEEVQEICIKILKNQNKFGIICSKGVVKSDGKKF